jgi:putative ABC transport system permease protein
VRFGLGATRAHVIGLVLGRALLLTAVGLAAGALVALLFTRLLTTLLFAVPAMDPTTFVAVAATLLAVAGLAGAAPVQRALRIEPVRALRGP